MANFTVIGLKVLILLLGTTAGIEPEKSGKQDYSIVAKVLQRIFNTYSTSLNQLRNNPDNTVEKYIGTVDKVIKRKITVLKPYLEDYINTKNEQGNIANNENNKDEDNNVTLEGDEETTIIEFIPHRDYDKQPLRIKEKRPEFRDNVRKYKKIRDHIKNTLIKESVSMKSQKLVINTLDSMLAYMVRSQCPNNEMSNDIYRERLRGGKDNLETHELRKNWTKQWDTVREKYNKIWRNHFPQQPNPSKKLFMFFEQIQDFLTTVINDSDYISNNYKVVCKLVKSDEREVNNIENDNLLNLRSSKSNLKCPAFIVCSDELEYFMKHFYRKINGTVVHTFRNYAAMYKSDINSDGSGEKEIVIAAIDKLGKTAKHKAKKIFKSETSTFELDHDRNADENIKKIKSYINDVIEKTLNSIKDNLNNSEMDDYLKKRLITNLKQDLSANIVVDLGNLRTEVKKEICRYFSSCNGRMIRRNLDEEIGTRRNLGSIDKNKVYVKLQLTLDKSLKEKIAKGDVDILDNFWKNNNNVRSIAHNIEVTRTSRKHHVTRTTQNEIYNEDSSSHSKKHTRMSTKLDGDAVVSEISTEM